MDVAAANGLRNACRAAVVCPQVDEAAVTGSTEDGASAGSNGGAAAVAELDAGRAMDLLQLALFADASLGGFEGELRTPWAIDGLVWLTDAACRRWEPVPSRCGLT